MNTPLHALIVEDSEEDSRLLLRELRRGNYDVTYRRVDTADALRDALGGDTWDMIFCDFSFPRLTGLEALQIVRESGVDTPFIFVSGKMGEDVAVEAMRSGAHDYVMKNNLARLVGAVERELRDAVERRQRRLAEEAMRVSEFKYRHLFESMSEAAFLIEEKSGRIIDVNRQAELLLGGDRAQILGLNQGAIFSSTSGIESDQVLAHCLAEGPSCECDIVRADGSREPVHLSVSRVDLYGRQCLFALLHGAAADRRIRLDREQTLRHGMRVLEAAAAGILGIDQESRCTYANPAVRRMLRAGGEELVGGDIRRMVDPTPAAWLGTHPIERTLANGESVRLPSVDLRRIDGTMIHGACSVAPIIEDGRIAGAVIVFYGSDETADLSLSGNATAVI
jgi:PAS domain S-box-containing protein